MTASCEQRIAYAGQNVEPFTRTKPGRKWACKQGTSAPSLGVYFLLHKETEHSIKIDHTNSQSSQNVRHLTPAHLRQTIPTTLSVRRIKSIGLSRYRGKTKPRGLVLSATQASSSARGDCCDLRCCTVVQALLLKRFAVISTTSEKTHDLFENKAAHWPHPKPQGSVSASRSALSNLWFPLVLTIPVARRIRTKYTFLNTNLQFFDGNRVKVRLNLRGSILPQRPTYTFGVTNINHFSELELKLGKIYDVPIHQNGPKCKF